MKHVHSIRKVRKLQWVILVLFADSSFAGNDIWKSPTSGNRGLGSNGLAGTAPSGSDAATFVQPSTYTVPLRQRCHNPGSHAANRRRTAPSFTVVVTMLPNSASQRAVTWCPPFVS